MKKKALSLILSAAMALSLTIVPVSAVSVSNFSDVSSDSWYYDSVSYVAEKDYMNGTSATTFEPNGNMTRAMFATVISRVAGAEVDNSAVSEFTDVESGKWYTGAIEWGVENDLLNGYGNGLFGTNNSITRQDICTLTQRFLNWYCEQNNCTLAVDPKVESFTDAASIADYAKEAVEFCRDAGLLTGYEDGSFRPLGTATRAEIAAVIERIEMAIESAEPAGPVVSYTDEDGNKATLAIKAGDVITVNPDGGSVTYDGTTHRDEFTITATEDGITLPNATRSGYRFDGWKVEKDANGAYIFTAQWTRTSSGGGGGGGVTQYTYTLDWNYDGEPEAVQNTVTRGTEIGLPTSLPDGKERDGYTLVSWTTVDDGTGEKYAAGSSYTVNSSVTLYAQWEEEGSTAVDYTVNLDLNAKGKNLNIKANAVDGNNVFEDKDVYHVVFNPDDTVNTAASDYIDLVSIAKDMCDSEAIQTVLDNLKDIDYTQDGQTKYFINGNGEVQEILIRKVAISEVLKNNINQIVEKIDLPDVNGTFVTGILDDLDNGKLASGELDPNEEATLSAIREELSDQIKSGDLYGTVQNIVSSELLTNLGFDETAINELAQEYLGKINNILGIDTDTIGLNALSVSTREGSDTSTAGGIEVRINPVKVLSEQYGTAESGYTGVWKQIEKVLGEDRTKELKDYKSVTDLIAACDPVKFFNEVDGVYTLKTAAEYTKQLKELINLAEAARQEVIIDEKRDAEWVENILKDIRTNLEEYSDSFADKLTDPRIEKLAFLLAKETPLLTDLVTNPDKAGTRMASVEMTAGGTEGTEADLNLDDIIERILDRIGVDNTDFDSTTRELIEQIVGKLSGTYSATVTIDVTECNSNN